MVEEQTAVETGIQDNGTLSGRGYWDKTEEEADVDRETMTKTAILNRN